MSYLKKARMQKGITPTELAFKVGVSQSAISCYERERRYPSLKIAFKIAEILDIDPMKLVKPFQ